MKLAPRVLLGLILGAVGGALAWICTDFFFNPPSNPEKMLHASMGLQFAYGGLIGGCIGLALGAADGLAAATRVHLVRRCLRGALSGFLGGAIGMNVGNVIFTQLHGQADLSVGGLGSFLQQIFIRALGWLVFGCLLGWLYGWFDSGTAKGRNGAIGGAIGGFIGGLIFNPLSFAIPNLLPGISSPDRIARLVGWIILGGFIGFFTALVTLLLKTAWVFVVYGRNEGREIIIETATTHIGRSELAEVPIFRDRLVAGNHAEIHRQNGRYTLVDGGSAVGTSVNGQKVAAPTLLRDSDLIQVGNTQVMFYERATAGPVRRQVDLAHAAPAAPPVVPDGVCPFCGERRDPATGACACSVAPSSGPSTLFPPTSSPFSQPVSTTGALHLIALSGAHAGEVFALSGGVINIGRDPGNEIALIRDTTVSRRHASMTPQGADYLVSDLGSSNGTFVNGARITTQTAHPGDEITFGTARFRLES